jgi:hypothetical protein
VPADLGKKRDPSSREKEAGGVAQAVVCLSSKSKHEALSSNPSTAKKTPRDKTLRNLLNHTALQ